MASHLIVALAVCLAVISTASATFSGDGTYYGDNGWNGYCMGNMLAKGKVWPPYSGSGIRVALNAPQFGPQGTLSPCGRKLMFRGTGAGAGGNPISTRWQQAIVTNLCPECKYGDLDLGMSGDGRWKIEWYWLDSGSGGNSVQSRGGSRASVKPKKKPTKKPTLSKARRAYLWKAWLRKQRAKRAAAARNKSKGRRLAMLRGSV